MLARGCEIIEFRVAARLRPNAVLLLGDRAEASGGYTIASTCSWAMLRTDLGLIETPEHHVGVVPKLA